MAAFPTARTRRTLAGALERAQSQADSIKRIAQNNRDRMAAGPITASGILSLLDNLRGARTILSETAALDGIAAYAQAQLGDETFDVAASFTDMMNAIEGAGVWIVTNFPKDAGGGHLLAETFVVGGDGGRVEREFTTAQTAQLRTLLDTLIATID